MSQNVQREQTDIGSYVNNAIAVGQSDSMTQIGMLGCDLLIEVISFILVEVGYLEPIWKSVAELSGEVAFFAGDAGVARQGPSQQILKTNKDDVQAGPVFGDQAVRVKELLKQLIIRREPDGARRAQPSHPV